jgi:hypothetical protein
VRWAHRVYKGEIDLMKPKAPSVVTTLVVFGDGILLVDSTNASGRIALATGGIAPVLPDRAARRRRRLLRPAGSSEEAAARLPEAKRIPADQIKSVHIDRCGWSTRELTIRSADDEVLRYRFASKRQRRVVELLQPVLKSRLKLPS